MTLDLLDQGMDGLVTNIDIHNTLKDKIISLGIRQNQVISVIKKNNFAILVAIKYNVIAIDKRLAEKIHISLI